MHVDYLISHSRSVLRVLLGAVLFSKQTVRDSRKGRKPDNGVQRVGEASGDWTYLRILHSGAGGLAAW